MKGVSERKVSVVVPVLNEADYLEKFFESWLSQSQLPKEIIVVDGGSRDKTLFWCGRYKRLAAEKNVEIKVITETRPGIVLARDKGIRQALGDYVYMADADTVYGSKNIELVEMWLDKGFVGVTGYATADKAIWFLKVINRVYQWHSQASFFLAKTVYGLRGYHNAFCRSAYLESGGMKTIYPSVEDELGLTSLLNRRGRIAYDPKITAITSSRRADKGLGQFLKYLLLDYWGCYWQTKWGRRVIYQRSVN